MAFTSWTCDSIPSKYVDFSFTNCRQKQKDMNEEFARPVTGEQV